MTNWHAFLLGLIQGFTEFLPISSSGHLALGQHFFGLETTEHFLLFSLICHLGTLIAIFFVLWKPIKEILSFQSRLFWQVSLATLPLFPLVLLIKPIKEVFNRPEFLGPGFLVTAFVLFLGLSYRLPSYKQGKWKDPLIVGLAQAVAIFPGISRSGSTISIAQCLGWKKEEAFRFSFLLAIPTILGGLFFEIIETLKAPVSITSSLSFEVLFIGFITSCLFGFIALKAVMLLLIKNKWYYFAWYSLCLGVGTTLYFNFLS